MTYKRMTLLLLVVGSLYLFSGLDMQANERLGTNAESTSVLSKLPVLFNTGSPAKQKVLYGAILLAAGGLFFVSSKRKEIKPE